jgi:hypothetical protein
MSVQRRRFNVRAPWMLPVILAILIILLVGGVVFGSKIKSAFNSPTATPAATQTPQVITATPAPNTTPAPNATPGTANPAAPATATPSSGQGASTPLPHSTLVPTVVGLTLGMITRPQSEVNAIQSGANGGNTKYTFYLDPRQVVQNTLPHYGFTQGVTIVSPNPSPSPTPHQGVDSSARPLITFIVSYQSKEYTVVVAQPVQRGPKGIWVIITILPGRQTI